MSMRILKVNIDKVLKECRSSHRRRCSIKKVFLKILQTSQEKNLCWSLFLIKFIKKGLQHRYFSVKFAKNLRTSVNDCFWQYFERSYWIPPQGFCILRNTYRLFKFSTLGSISQHGTLEQIMSNASSLYMTQLAGKESNNFQQVSKLIELKSISTP